MTPITRQIPDSMTPEKRSMSNKVITAGIDFLKRLFRDTQFNIEIRCLPSTEQLFSTNIAEIDMFIKNNNRGQNIYFGCCTREGARGNKHACREVVALWLDIDFKDFVTGEGNVDKTLESMIPPSVIIHTGNGYHIYWLLREPIEAIPEIIEPYLKGLAQHYNGDKSAAELARVLRLPGTYNLKNGQKKPVIIIRSDYSLQYNLSDFDDLKIDTLNTRKNTPRTDSKEDIIPDGQRNSTLTSLAGTMRRRNMTESEIASALYVVNRDRCRPPLPDQEVDAIAKSVGRYDNTQKPSGNDNLVMRFGVPYYLNRYGIVTGVNEAYWAGLYAAKHIILYEPDERAFYLYCIGNGLYCIISTDLVKQTIASSILEASRVNNIPSLEEYKDNSNLNHIIAHLKGIAEKRGAFNRDRKTIHVSNGVIVFNDTREADLYDFSHEFYSRNQSPISFDSHAKCDRFLNELVYPAVTLEDALLIQKYVGLCLLGNNLIQRLLILDGLPGRGKTQLILVIQKIIGQLNVSELRTKHLSDRFELYRYLKKTLLVGVDVPGNFLSEKGAYIIKGLVGGDMFDAEQKGGTGCFPFQGNFCIVITSNSRLQVRLDGDIGAWRRRLLIVRYEAPPPKRKIPNFADMLIQQEGSGILHWALQGLGMLLSDIDECGDIKLTEAQIGRVDALLAESDSLRNFLIDNVRKADHTDLSVAEIVEAYAQYCPTKGWNPKPITNVYRDIEGLMLELFGASKGNSVVRDGKSVRGYRRVTFNKGWE